MIKEPDISINLLSSSLSFLRTRKVWNADEMTEEMIIINQQSGMWTGTSLLPESRGQIW